MATQGAHRGSSPERAGQLLIAAMIALNLAVFAACLQGSLGWINRHFPGFLLLENRIVAAAGCPFWQEMKKPEILHARLHAVNGRELAQAEQLGDLTRAQTAPSRMSYVLETRSGKLRSLTNETRLFTVKDYLALFGVYFLNGVLYLAVALYCLRRRPSCAATPGFLAVGILAGLWAFTACDLYGPYRFFRLHILGETLLPAAILHLALVFPGPLGTSRQRSRALLALYSTFLLLALLYEALAFHTEIYPLFNRFATAALGASMAVFLLRCGHVCLAGSPKFSRRALRMLLLLAMAAFGPSVAVSAGSLLNGLPPVNYVGYSSFLFPLGLALLARQLRPDRPVQATARLRRMTD